MARDSRIQGQNTLSDILKLFQLNSGPWALMPPVGTGLWGLHEKVVEMAAPRVTEPLGRTA